jgi:CHASE3 domain sensor protein
MSNPSRERFIFGAAILLLTVYSAILTFGLFRVQHNAEQLAKEQRATTVAADKNVLQLVQYLETYHGGDDNGGNELQRLKILMEEHEQKLFLLQDTIAKLYAVP